MEKIKEKESKQKKKQEELKKNLQQEVCLGCLVTAKTHVAFSKLSFLHFQEEELTLEEQLAEKLRVKQLQEESDLELTKDAFGKDPYLS